MNTGFDLDKVKELLARFAIQAEELVKDPSKVEELLQQLEEKLKTIPTVGEGLSKVPLMISMIRAYVRKEYTEVPPKVIVTMVCAVLYLLKGRDIIPDKMPVVGYADDIAVFAAVFMMNEQELDAYSQWREGGAAPQEV